MLKFIRFICFTIAVSFLISACTAPVSVHKNTSFELQKESDHFSFYCLPEYTGELDELSESLEAGYRKATRNYNITFDSRVKVTIYPSIDEFKQAIDENDIPDWLAADEHDGEIKMISQNNSEYTYNKQNIPLQANGALLSVLLEKINNKIPVYLSTGIYIYEMGLIYNASKSIVSDLHDGSFPTLKQLQDLKEEDDEFVQYSCTLVEYIIDNYGYNKLEKFVKKPNIKSVFGVTKEKFEKDWIEYTKSIYDKQFDLEKETEHFIFHYMEQDSDVAEEIAAGLENNYSRITTDLKAEPLSKVTVKIFPDEESFQKEILHDGMPTWASGYVKDSVCIKMISSNAPTSRVYDEDKIRLAVNEFTHTVLAGISQNVPRFIAEGTAQYESGNSFGVSITVASALRNNAFPTIIQLHDYEREDGVYQFGYAFVSYVIAEYGYDKLIELIKTPDIQAVFGISESEFEVSWKAYLKKKYYIAD